MNSSVKRTPSTRSEGITQLKFESTTNKHVDSLCALPARLRSPTLEATRAQHDQGHVHFYRSPPVSSDGRVIPTRPAPSAPSHSDDTAAPSRPPPPKRYLHSTNPRPSTHNTTEDSYENIRAGGRNKQVSLNSSTDANGVPVRPPKPTTASSTEPKPPSVSVLSNKFKSIDEVGESQPRSAIKNKSRFESVDEVHGKPAAKKTVSDSDFKPRVGKKPNVPNKPTASRSASSAASTKLGEKPQLKAKPSLNLQKFGSSNA